MTVEEARDALQSGQSGRDAPGSMAFSSVRYLAAKRSVDDRALNRHVWQTLADAVRTEFPEGRPPRVLEVGAGIGTMVERCVEWGLFRDAEYTAIDSEERHVEVARARLAAFTQDGDPGLRLELGKADLYDFCTRRENRKRFDLVIAHALLDLLDMPRALTSLLRTCTPGALLYFTINFDGATLLLPEIDPALDRRIEALYHRAMDERITDGRASGDSRTGRRLFHALRDCGAEALAAGSSDWVVHAVDGAYPADEAYFLHCILHFVESTLRGHAELDAPRFADWLAARREQLARGDLVYVAHQLDFCARAR